MKKLFFLIFVLMLALTGLISCGGDRSSSENTANCDDNTGNSTDSVSITSVSPASAVENVSSLFTVEVSYTLASCQNGSLMIGFNTDHVSGYTVDDEYSVTRGSGTHTFNVTATPVDWADEGDFGVFVNLSEDPHPSTWSPLDSDFSAISVNQAAPGVPLSPGINFQCVGNICYEN